MLLVLYLLYGVWGCRYLHKLCTYIPKNQPCSRVKASLMSIVCLFQVTSDTNL